MKSSFPISCQTVRRGVTWSLLVVIVFHCLGIARNAIAETTRLRTSGRTLIEGEDYSAASEAYPYAEFTLNSMKKCSGRGNLGFFWENSWFEIEVEVPQMLNYQISLQASSPKGTTLEVQLVSATENTLLTEVEVPQTGDWHRYSPTETVMISLPAGIQTLRFKNTGSGANIDFVIFDAGSSDDVVIDHPKGNAGPNTNPLKGFSSGWWREEKHASVGFQYIEWGKLEPEDDRFDWNYVEQVLQRPGSRERHLIIQLVIDWDNREPLEANYLGPDWLLKRVGEQTGNALPDDPKSRKMRATRYDHPEFVAESTEAIAALINRYKDDPRTFVLQAGVLGFWGEWHTFPREDWSPTSQTKQAVIDAYLDNLGPTGLTQVRYPDEEVNKPQPRMGYTNGSATLSSHGLEFGEQIERGQLWKNGPIHGEWPPNVETPKWKRFFQSDEGKQFIQQARYSTLLPPELKEISARLPDNKHQERFMQMHRQMGYTFQVSTVQQLFSADRSGKTFIDVELHNTGIAPFYKKWDVQLAILEKESKNVKQLLPTNVDITSLSPGNSILVAGSTEYPLNPRVDYQLGLRIIQPGANQPKAKPWKLSPRHVYVVLANDVEVVEGKWLENHALHGGWNIMADVEQRLPIPRKSAIQTPPPTNGSFRPIRLPIDKSPRTDR